MLRVAIVVAAGIVAGGIALYQYLSLQPRQNLQHPYEYRPHNQPKPSTSRDPSSPQKCGICFENLLNNQKMNFPSKCSHQFHVKCLEAILKEGQTICPVRTCMKSFE